VVFATGNGIVRLGGGNEVAGDQAGALVDELVEGVLAVGAWLAPHDRTCAVVDGLARLADELSVALHITLLEIGGKTVQVLIVGQQGVCFRLEEVGVPNSE